MTLTGRHPVHYWAQMKGPRAWFPLLIGIVALAIMPAMFSARPKSLVTLLMQVLDLGAGKGSCYYKCDNVFYLPTSLSHRSF